MRVVPVFLLAGLMLLAAILVAAATAARVRPADPDRYRPRPHRKTGTHFEDEVSSDATAPGVGDTAGPSFTDFVTGAPLDPAGGVVRCDDCRACYHPDTVALLAELNGGGCASCGGTSLQPVFEAELRRGGGVPRHRALVPEPATPEAYAAAIGRLVTVRGVVLRSLPAQRGRGPSLLMHDAGGTRFRLAFAGEAARGLRGRAFVNGLIGSRLRLRGLLLRDEAHGLRLLVLDRAMVLEVAD
jgi:hypothetical protein